jgi:hypothetical protein
MKAVQGWVLKHGIPYVLIMMPMNTLLVGVFFRWTTWPQANIATILAFLALAIYVPLRLRYSDDPDEPLRRLPALALLALFPIVVYNLVRIPMHYLLGVVFWDHWYDYGSELTGLPVDQWSTLFSGTILHVLQGYVLVLGYYVLFKRKTWLNGLVYVFFLLSSIYSWTFPTFILVDFQPPPKWFFVVWWAHFWLALTAVAVYKLYESGYFRRFTGVARSVGITVLVLVWFVPLLFVVWRVGTWQFPYQWTIDQATFRQAQLEFQGEPLSASTGPITAGAATPGVEELASAAGQPPREEAIQEARYQYTLRFGPRSYTDYINATKALDAGPVRVTGTLVRDGEIIASCFAYVEKLETPNNITDPSLYFPTLKRMEHTYIPVECVGPAAAAEDGGRVNLLWTADVQLIGDKFKTERTFTGNHQNVSISWE